jgi:nitrite reductase/ring-hydroxylating ferredoxin subunit
MADSGSNTKLEGTAYGRKPAHSNQLLAKVGPGTPCGEWMRRYWQPLTPSDLVTNRPREIRILGEDLIVFRDKSGRPGLLYPRCMHRGTTLFYGRVEERGIRCCYHGWLFDVEGNCLEQPCEPDGGKNREAARQPWYPVREAYGLVWTYMGPPDRMPVLPRFDNMELEDGQSHMARVFGVNGEGGPDPVMPYSWLHMNDNVMDPFHVQQLHSTISNIQFVEEFAVMPTVDFRYIPNGVIYDAYRKLDDGREVNRISTWILPHVMSVPSVVLAAGRSGGLGFTVPVDDTHSRNIMAMKIRRGAGMFGGRGPGPSGGGGGPAGPGAGGAGGAGRPAGAGPGGGNRTVGMAQMKRWADMTIEERQDNPGDYEAQVGQGPISLHSEEHLATSDRGIAMQRRMMEQQIKTVMEGGDPVGVAFDEKDAVIHVPSGNFFK